MVTLGFFMSTFDSDRGNELCTSLIVSAVIGHEFNMAHTFTNNGHIHSSSRLYQLILCALINPLRIDRAILIFLSVTPPMWLAASEFRSQIIQSAMRICR